MPLHKPTKFNTNNNISDTMDLPRHPNGNYISL